ncbi:MAG: hypothetical protein U1F13_02580 [Acinetobacter parvus]
MSLQQCWVPQWIRVAEAVRNLGFIVTPEMLTVLAQEVGESSILSRTGGAPTFAIGMAHIISEIFNKPFHDGILVSLCHPV